jgi:hypothetical protein
VNEALKAAPASERSGAAADTHASGLVLKLQMFIQEVNNSLEATSTQVHHHNHPPPHSFHMARLVGCCHRVARGVPSVGLREGRWVADRSRPRCAIIPLSPWQVVEDLPRVIRSVDMIHQEVGSLKERISVVKEDVERVERDTADSMRLLMQFDEVSLENQNVAWSLCCAPVLFIRFLTLA